MKEVENVKGAIDKTFTQVVTKDFFPVNSTKFKTIMKTAGVSNVESDDAMRSLFVAWLMGVKEKSTADVIGVTKLSKAEKLELGNEFMEYFEKRPVLGNAGTVEEVESHIRDYSKMIYRARKQIFFKEDLKYPTRLNQRNEATYQLLRKETFGFAAEFEMGLESVTANWLYDNTNKTQANPNGISFSNAFMEGYGDKKVPIGEGTRSYAMDQNKIKLVRSIGKLTEKLSDKKLSKAEVDHYIRVGKFIPHRRNRFMTDEEWDKKEKEEFEERKKSGEKIAQEYSIDKTASEYGLLIGDILESMVNSVPSVNGENLNEKSLNGMQESLERFNESHEKELNNAFNIIAHNDNSFVNELAINKNGKPLSEASEKEIDEAAEAFDKLYGSVTKVSMKYYHAKGGANVLTQITINGEKATDIAERELEGKDVGFLFRAKYAKAIAMRAFVEKDKHLFYQPIVGNVDPNYELHTSGAAAAQLKLKDSVPMKPEDFKVGLKYDIPEVKSEGKFDYNEVKAEKVTAGTKFKATKDKDAQLPPPEYGDDIDVQDFKDVKLEENKAIAHKVGVVKKAAANPVPPVNNPADNEIIENNIVENKIIVDGIDKEEENDIIDDHNMMQTLIARNFVMGAEAYEEGLAGIVEWLTALKGSITMNMKDPEKFGTKDCEGSQQFKDFSRLLQKTINTFKNPDKDSITLGKALEALKQGADTYVTEQIMFRADADGAVTNAAFDVLARHDGMSYLLYNMRLGVNVYTKENELGKINSYGNLSLNEIKTKAAETREEFKNTEVFQNGWQKPQFEYMLKVAEAQRKIQKKMEKVSKTMCRNYEYTKQTVPDKYLEMSNKRSASDLARWIETKKFLDKLYRPGISLAEVEELGKITPKQLKNKISALAKNPLFKKTVRDNPNKAFSAWEAAEKKSGSLMTACDDKMKEIIGERTEAQLITDTINSVIAATDEFETKREIAPFARYAFFKALKNPNMTGITRYYENLENNDMNTMISAVTGKINDKVLDLINGKRGNARENAFKKILDDPKFVHDAMKNIKKPQAEEVKKAQPEKTVKKTAMKKA
ncbi:MAG: hypothetical protein K5750_09325 [Eubacterium sp.]|nr:hypothetical protein [Eubacterium sp.]